MRRAEKCHVLVDVRDSDGASKIALGPFGQGGDLRLVARNHTIPINRDSFLEDGAA